MSSGVKAILLLCAIAVVAIGAVLLMKPVSIKVRPKPTIASELAKIRASGAPLTLRELAGRPVPDDRNGAVIYEKAFKEIGKLSSSDLYNIGMFISPDERKKDPALWSKARTAISRCRKIESLVEQAVAKPECKFKHDWHKGALEVEFPEFRWLRELSRVLAADAILSARNGDMNRALYLAKLGLRSSASAEECPTLIGYLVRVATLKITLHALSQIVDRYPVTEKQAHDLLATLARTDLTPHLVRAIQADRAMGIWVFDETRRGRPIVALQSGETLDRDELYYLQEMARWIDSSRQPYRVVHRKGLDRGPNPPAYARISDILLPILGRMTVPRDSAEAQIALVQTALALRAYNKRYGSYPDTIKELRQKLGWRITEDPFSGKDLVYRKTPNRYLLYSIGEDLKDNGGRPYKGDKGDLVWGKLH